MPCESESHSVLSDSVTPWIIQSMEFSRPEYWSGWLFPSSGDRPNPGNEPRSPTLQVDSLSAEPQGKPSFSLPYFKRARIRLTAGLSTEIMKITQLCPTLCEPMDYTVYGILQARILEWVAVPFSRVSSQPRDRTQVSCIASGFFTS